MGESWRRWVRSGARLLRDPGFALVASGTLGLGIGAAAAVFSVVWSVLLRPLPYPDAPSLVWLDHDAPGIGVEEGGLGLTPGIFGFYRRENRSLVDMGSYHTLDGTLTGGDEPERVRVGQASWTLTGTLGVEAVLGRGFRSHDGEDVALLADGLWRRRYGADPGVLGRSIVLDGVPREVVGVLPGGFRFPENELPVDVWIPEEITPATPVGGFSRRGVGRRRPGWDAAAVAGDLGRLVSRLPDAFPGTYIRSAVEEGGLEPRVLPLQSHLVGDVARTLWVALAVVGLLLTATAANVAGLWVVRTQGRSREVAVRRALGASRGALWAHHLRESALVAGAAGALAVVLGALGVEGLVALAPSAIPRLEGEAFGPAGLGVAVLLAAGAAVGLALLAASDGRSGWTERLREGGRGETTGGVRARVRSVLVMGQTSLAVLLLVTAGLMVRSFANLLALDPGFRPEGALTVQIGLPEGRYGDAERAAAFQAAVLERVAALPGVVTAGAAACLPLRGGCGGDPLQLRERPPEPGVIPPVVRRNVVSPGYFRAAGIPLRSGRELVAADHEEGTGAVVVSAALARRFWPGEDPLGREISMEGREGPWFTVVGVAGDVAFRGLTEPPVEMVYHPMVGPGGAGPDAGEMILVVRTAVAPRSVVPAVRAVVAELDPDVPLGRVETLGEIVDDAAAPMRFTMLLVGVAAAATLLLGVLGVYGVLAWLVGRRRAEIGVRMALGARAEQVRRMILRQGAVLAAAGILLGTGVAVFATKAVRSLLFGVSPTDPVSFAAAAALVLAVTLAAGWIPARRAAAVDPATALRRGG